MNRYDNLISLAHNEGIKVIEADLGIDKPFGKCIGNTIIINSRVSNCEKGCVLSEELGHFNLTVGHITNQNIFTNKKQELIARRWSYEKLVSLDDIINALQSGVSNICDLAENLNVTTDFLIQSIEHYKRKYGVYYVGDKYLLVFEPLHIVEMC